MLKKTFFIIFSFVSFLQSETLELKNITFVTENDADIRTDSDYTYGSELALLFYRKDLTDSFFHIPFTDYKNQDNYISLSYTQKIYTPKDIEMTALIENDRPYAGYMYLSTALHQVYDHNLKTLKFQMGFVGPSTRMDKVQDAIHSLIGTDKPEGWANQLGDEFIMQINYADKTHMQISKNSDFMYEYGFELGNSSTKGYGAVFYRWGDLPNDFGSSQISNTSNNKIPLVVQNDNKKEWSYCFNFSLQGNLIAHDIFLDGNSFKDSHSVEKNIFVADVGYGVSLNYENFSIDYLRKHSSHQFKAQDRYPSYGSLIFSYNY